MSPRRELVWGVITWALLVLSVALAWMFYRDPPAEEALAAPVTAPAPPADPLPDPELFALELRLAQLESTITRLEAERVADLAGLASLEDLVPPELRQDVVAAARAHGVDARLIGAVGWHESRWQLDVTGRAGEQCPMQVLPSTAVWIARTRGIDTYSLTDLPTCLDFATWYLALLLAKYDGDVERALVEYNGGPQGHLKQASRGYSRRVMALIESGGS